MPPLALDLAAQHRAGRVDLHRADGAEHLEQVLVDRDQRLGAVDLGRRGTRRIHLAAFELLYRIGILDRDTNLLLRKHEIAETFSTEVLAEADRLRSAGLASTAGRRDLRELGADLPAVQSLSDEVCRLLDVEWQYAPYIERQREQIERQKELADVELPPDLDYRSLSTLRLEAREKLSEVRPRSLGQAGRISGVSPADVSVLLLHLRRIGVLS